MFEQLWESPPAEGDVKQLIIIAQLANICLVDEHTYVRTVCVNGQGQALVDHIYIYMGMGYS